MSRINLYAIFGDIHFLNQLWEKKESFEQFMSREQINP